MVGLRSADTFIVVPAVRRSGDDGIEPSASQHVDAVSGPIETIFDSDNLQRAFCDDAKQYKSGPATVITTA